MRAQLSLRLGVETEHRLLLTCEFDGMEDKGGKRASAKQLPCWNNIAEQNELLETSGDDSTTEWLFTPTQIIKQIHFNFEKIKWLQPIN